MLRIGFAACCEKINIIMAKKSVTIETEGMHSYETFCVYDALNKAAKNANAQFIDPKSDFGYINAPDIYAPEGIPSLGLRGETIIEIKKNLSHSVLNAIQSFINSHSDKYNVVIVYFSSSLTDTPTQIEKNNKVIMYISYDELKKGKRGGTKLEESFYLDRNRTIDWKKERESLITKANVAVQQGNNVLFLGAGVSMSANMPSWNSLLQGLMSEVKQLKEPSLSAFKELNTHVLEECGNSYLVMARYIQSAIHQYDKNANFSELIQKYLYNENHSSPLLNTISSIVQQKKVNEVITYNFDDILEQNLKKRGMTDSVDFTSISKDAEIKGHNTLPIYHVHGIIPEVGIADTVVFSEEEYHKRYANSYHWSNVEQLHALSRMHCFFIGLSMTDPNLRRLLDVAHNMNRTNEDTHFAFLRRTKLEDYCMSGVENLCKYVHISKSLIDENKQKLIYNLNYGVIENIFREFGVQVIWFEDFEELPKLLDQVFAMSKYRLKETDELLALCKVKIERINVIETDIPKFSPVNISIPDIAKFLEYKSKYADKYKELITEVKDILNELSTRVKIDNLETIQKLQKQVPTYNESFSGFASFYSIWYESVKICLG